MNPNTITTLVVVGAAVIIGIAYMVNTGMSYRARLKAEANIEANDAIAAARAIRDHTALQLDESRELAAKMRAQREWIEANPEEFHAALRAKLNGAAPVTDR